MEMNLLLPEDDLPVLPAPPPSMASQLERQDPDEARAVYASRFDSATE